MDYGFGQGLTHH